MLVPKRQESSQICVTSIMNGPQPEKTLQRILLFLTENDGTEVAQTEVDDVEWQIM